MEAVPADTTPCWESPGVWSVTEVQRELGQGDSPTADRQQPEDQRHHLPMDQERDSVSAERGQQRHLMPIDGGHTQETDILSGERLHPWRENQRERSSPDRRHPVRGDFQGELQPMEGDHTLNYKRDPSMERHHPMRGGYQRQYLPMDGNYTLERDSLSPASGQPGRGSYHGERQLVGGYDRLSVDRAHTMKDFEKQITELKKENFNLKLRIYFLEEQVQKRCDNSSEELHRMNIELKVEVESLKHEFQEKQKLLVRASKAMESLAGEHGSAVQRMREEHLKQLQDMQQEPLNKNIHLLQEELTHTKAELEKICSLLDQERLQRFNGEERLLALKEQYTKSVGILEERNWIIQCLNETMRSKDTLIAQLEKQIATVVPRETSSGKASKSLSNLFPESVAREDALRVSDSSCNVDIALKSLTAKEETGNEWQKKIKEMDNLINELQQKVEANKTASAIEEKNALKRDKAIQGLTLALKTKSKENDKLLNEIDNLNAALAKARESAQFRDIKENIDPEYRKLIFTLQSEQEIYSKFLQYERESGGLQKELDAITMLRSWLEDSIQAHQELRKIMEAQIMAKCRENDTISFIGDQTSYLSICLDHLDQNYYYLAEEQYGKKQNSSIVENGEPFSLIFMDGSRTQTDCQVTEGQHVDCKFGLPGNKSEKREKLENTAMQPKNDNHRENTVSSSSQTELKYYADKSTLVDISTLGKESAGGIDNLQGGRENNIYSECHKLTLKSDIKNCEIQRDLQQKQCANQGTKRSRLPVLLKSSSNIKLKTDNPLILSKVENHICLEEELQIENCRLYDQLKCAEMEIESLKANEALVKHMDNPPNLESSNKVERDSPEHTLQQELQLENYRLSEQLKYAQMEIEKLKSGGIIVKPMGTVPDLENTSKVDINSLEQSLQIENNRLSEQLKSAQMEMEKLQADIEDIDRSDKLDNSGAEDTFYPELSFLDKTITNSINAIETHDEKLEFEVDVCRRIVDRQNEAEINCLHDHYCVECANDRETLILQTSSSKKVLAIQEQCNLPKLPNSGRSFEDSTSLSKYDLLVQAQARELSLQRQKIKESHNLSIICSKNFFNILKAFKDLLPTSDLDSNRALGFEEQLTQTVEWLKDLEYKLSDAFYGEEDAYSDHSVDSLLYTPSRLVPGHRMWADKRGCHVLGLVEDYDALRKQILEAKNVLQETEAFVDHGVQSALLNMTEHFGDIFFEKLNRTKQSLEEANCLLKLLWRVSLPIQIHGSYNIHQEEETNREITRLRKRVLEQEKLLSGMVKRVYSENQMKEDVEKFILDRLAVTHDILKRAKRNLEVQVVDKHH
ncbi:uncharacterized protein LOC142140675 [Mixophyes fleayi]|uniref:uncharacterized protein LOC142140675 n=1 Tax=Mixophyes fleayi TaxID=3061075 RepID=UPI003F4DFFDA